MHAGVDDWIAGFRAELRTVMLAAMHDRRVVAPGDLRDSLADLGLLSGGPL